MKDELTLTIEKQDLVEARKATKAGIASDAYCARCIVAHAANRKLELPDGARRWEASYRGIEAVSDYLGAPVEEYMGQGNNHSYMVQLFDCGFLDSEIEGKLPLTIKYTRVKAGS